MTFKPLMINHLYFPKNDDDNDDNNDNNDDLPGMATPLTSSCFFTP